ncbi:MAG: TonB-dependent receptor [Bacteroidota bacterium]|nr:TonB-dependent receptor [Bacteroidota bacterium]MDP3146215.1 TonB-dependent receptor [Bacteroidota bacterium]
MTVTINKHFACGFNFKIKAVILLALATNYFFAQDTISLKNVEVRANRIELSRIGKKTETIDSTIKQQFKFNSIADVLSLNTPIFIKSYGPGALSTTSFRGGNASQTAILWNGFNIQNAMLGQSDLSLIPASLFENIEIEYGGSSSLWGSGAVGGSIHLKNSNLFNQGLTTSASIGAGSFGLKNLSTNILFSKSRFISSTKVYNNISNNNFNYKDTTDKENQIKQQKNADYNFLGLMQELKFLINSKQILSVNAWINSNQRRLPSYDYKTESKTYQDDVASRITADWSFINTNFKSTIRAGYFNDKINYTDSLVQLFSKSKTQTLIAENENYLTWNKKHQLNFGVNFTSSSATTNNYASTKSLNKLSFLLGNKFSFLNNKLLVYTAARIDYFSTGAFPITGNVSADYKLTKQIALTLNGAKVYRHPTLNELYWLPGGNINLKPEQGYTQEGAINYNRQINNTTFFVSGAVFNRKINDWILWIPGAGGNPSPINIQQVWSRGAETTWRVNYIKNKFRCAVNIVTGYVLSTIESNNQENNNSVNKQLIYTPRYTINSNVLIGYKKTAITFFNQYVGYRYTTSDNSQWLNPYQISSLRLNHTINFKVISFNVFGACNNLFNENYTILLGRPMPLRNYEIGITLQTKK